jgi:hypothetical protein
MANVNREIQELLADYAVALRDGCLPSFLKSLTREEAKNIKECPDFWDAAGMVRLMNSAGFANKLVTPDVGLFTSRVDARIASRQKTPQVPTRTRQRTEQRTEVNLPSDSN